MLRMENTPTSPDSRSRAWTAFQLHQVVDRLSAMENSREAISSVVAKVRNYLLLDNSFKNNLGSELSAFVILKIIDLLCFIFLS
jgi:hypothetical protein